MWRSIGLVAIVAAISAAACGGGGNGGDTPSTPAETVEAHADETRESCNFLTLEPTVPPALAVSLEEASEMLGFEPLLPEDLPDDIAMEELYITRSPTCPDRVLNVTILYRGPDYSFGLLQNDFESHGLGPDATPVVVNGFEGERAFRGDSVILLWQQGDVVIDAITELKGEMTEDRFLEILESIPE